MILCRQQHGKQIDKSVFPGLQGGPHMNAIAGIAMTLEESAGAGVSRPTPRRCCATRRRWPTRCSARGCTLVTGGTDNHMMVLDTVASSGIDGRAAERRLDAIAITTNKQVIPDDPNPPLRPSGIRLGTPAATTRGMGEAEMRQLGEWIADTLRDGGDPGVVERRRGDVAALCEQFPVPGLPDRTDAAAGAARPAGPIRLRERVA